MVREIIHDPMFLAKMSEAATAADLSIGEDLADTLKAHAHECVGLAANMIGVLKRVIVVDAGGACLIMYNPAIVKKREEYTTQEGCLSLAGVRPCRRYQFIAVRYMDEKFKPQLKSFSGWTAEIIQHEIDHCNGVLI